jgi:photosystem II stability/assembly factor-like uncharacterized protein
MKDCTQSTRAITAICFRARFLAVLACLWLGLPGHAQAQGAQEWITLWQDAYKDLPDRFNPERLMYAIAFADRTTGDAYLSMWNYGVWKSSDGGRSFARADGGKISGEGCGPISYSAQISPAGKKIALFNMNNAPGPSGYSLDGGKSWESFTSVGRNWDFGAMDWDSKTVIAARHEDDGLHVSLDAGQTWTRLVRSRGPVTGLGVAGAKMLLLGTNDAIERSSDDGATWVKVSDLGGFASALTFKNRLWWFSGPGKHSIITSADQGKTWSVRGAPLPEAPMFGPQFGKDENHIVMATKAGFHETTDGCKTWKLAVQAPDDSTLQAGAFDPIHDIFYAICLNLSNHARCVLKYERSGGPQHALSVATTPQVPAVQPRPKAQLIHVPSPKLRVLNPLAMDYSGDYFYVGGEDGIVYFKRDPAAGKLNFIDQLGELKCGGYTVACAGGRMYAVTPHNGYRRMSWHGLAWYEFDATGKPCKKGIVECPASRQVVVGPGQKDLYLKACGGRGDKLFWYQIAADGKPAKAGEVMGKGIGASSHNAHPGIMQMSPDGKNLYCISGEDYTIACIQRAPGGAISYRGPVDLTPVAKRDPANGRFQWVSLGISADGRWLYAGVRNGKPSENFYGIFQRDTATGDLTFRETISGDKDPLANQHAWSTVFLPGGGGGFVGSWTGPIVSFSYDPQTGRLANPGLVKDTKGFGSPLLILDAQRGLLYAGGGEFGTSANMLSVIKVGK